MKYLQQMTVLGFETATSSKSNSAVRSFTRIHQDREKAIPLFWLSKQKSHRRITNELCFEFTGASACKEKICMLLLRMMKITCFK